MDDDSVTCPAKNISEKLVGLVERLDVMYGELDWRQRSLKIEHISKHDRMRMELELV